MKKSNRNKIKVLSLMGYNVVLIGKHFAVSEDRVAFSSD
jgi:hypothetical protein